METINLGKAKKQRDAARLALNLAVNTIHDNFPGLTRFEIAHAVADSLLVTINQQAENSGQIGMPHQFGQTLLPGTQALIDGNPEPKPALAPGAYMQWDDLLPQKPAPKVATKKSDGLKLDINVTEDDCMGTLYFETSGYKYSEAKKSAEDMLLVYYPVMGKTWSGGYKILVWAVPAKSPYLTSKQISGSNLKPYNGFKFRKLKNKDIYKVVPLPTNKKYDKGAKDDAGNIDAPVIGTHLPTGTTTTLKVGETYTGLFYNKITLPNGYGWKKAHTKDLVQLIKVPKSGPASTPDIGKAPSKYNLYDVVDLAIALDTPAPKGTHWEHKNTLVGKAVLMDGSGVSKKHDITGPHPYPNGYFS